ncbi:MAG TPA: hypothetical protein VFF06_35000 [Polyangia bacterium]|nr:hypothetical protein [Polyangia bacterium]
MFRKLSLLFLVGVAGCLGGGPAPNPNPGPTQQQPDPNADTGPLLGIAPGGTSGGVDNTFNHDLDNPDPFAILDRIQQQGPPEISTRMHSCQKLKYATLGNVLKDLGVNLGAQSTPPSAGQLYAGGAQAMGGPNYGARVAETIELTAAGATKLFDIFSQAAQEIITAMPMTTRCMGTNMFDASNHCTAAGITCLQGAPASQAQLDLCNQALTEGSTPQISQTIAVASILAAAHTCE